ISTLGLFTLPLSVGWLVNRRPLRLNRWQLSLAAILASAVLAGLIVRTVVLGQSPLFPHAKNVLSSHGFQAFDYDGTLPQGIDIPDTAIVLATVAALTGAGLLMLAAVSCLSRVTAQ